jgi:hypothetical protein
MFMLCSMISRRWSSQQQSLTILHLSWSVHQPAVHVFFVFSVGVTCRLWTDLYCLTRTWTCDQEINFVVSFGCQVSCEGLFLWRSAWFSEMLSGEDHTGFCSKKEAINSLVLYVSCGIRANKEQWPIVEIIKRNTRDALGWNFERFSENWPKSKI